MSPALAIEAPFDPAKVALGPDGNIYAIIAGNESVCYHIYVYAPDGRELKIIDVKANDMAFDEAGNLYLLNVSLNYDLTNYSISKLDRNGTTTVLWRNYCNGTRLVLGSMAVSPDGHVYINKFYIQQDTGTAVNESELKENRIVRLEADGSEHVIYAENNTVLPGGFHSMAVDADGTIYAAGSRNEIKVIALNGTVTTIGKLGSANGTFNMITGVSIGKDGYLYVTEYGNRRVQKLTMDGTFIAKWNGVGQDQFIYPWNAAVDKDGRVYVADGHNQRIVWFTPGYVFGENTTENLKGQGTTWGNVYAGANYTTVMRQIEEEKAAAAATPGFAAFASITGLFLAGAALCLWRAGMRR